MTEDAKVCPHCGFDIAIDQPIIINEFAMINATSPLRYNGQPVRLTASERSIVWALMKAWPNHVTHDALRNRLGSESEGNVIDVYCSRIRNKLREIGAPIPFETRRVGGGRFSFGSQGRRVMSWIA